MVTIFLFYYRAYLTLVIALIHATLLVTFGFMIYIASPKVEPMIAQVSIPGRFTIIYILRVNYFIYFVTPYLLYLSDLHNSNKLHWIIIPHLFIHRYKPIQKNRIQKPKYQIAT